MEAVELLLSRDSAVKLQDPGPSEEALDLIFKSALRAPDHGRLRPWRFVVIRSQQRERFGKVMAELLRARQPDATVQMLNRESQKALRAPIIIVTAARTTPGKVPDVEQILSAGAAAQNIMLAAHALGYGAMWRTGPAAYDVKVKLALGLEPTDSITGFIYIGTRADGTQPPAKRPVSAELVSDWQG